MRTNGNTTTDEVPQNSAPPAGDFINTLGIVSAREGRATRLAWGAIIVAVISIGVNAALGVGLLRQVQNQRGEPFPVGVTEDGRVIILGKPSQQWILEELWVRQNLERWLISTRGLTIDEPHVIRSRAWAFEMMTDLGVTQIRAFFLTRPLSVIGQQAIDISDVTITPPQSGQTWELHWNEQMTNLGMRMTTTKKWHGYVTLKIQKPEIRFDFNGQVVDATEAKHLGIWVVAFSWEERP